VTKYLSSGYVTDTGKLLERILLRRPESIGKEVRITNVEESSVKAFIKLYHSANGEIVRQV